MDIIDDIIDMFYGYGRAHFIGKSEYEVFIFDERKLREKIKKLLRKR